MHTRRAYLDDPYRRTFTADVLATGDLNGSPTVILAETCFYPEGGGQPADQGTIGPARVLDVQEGADGRIVHILDRPLAVGEHAAAIDWSRRFDHMQQHSGQHLLSRCFEVLHRAATVSFHLGAGEVTIDLDGPEVSPDEAAQAEALANTVVFENRAVSSEDLSVPEAAALGVSCPAGVSGSVRVVTIADFDQNACGGTHVRATGEIGPVKIRRLERVRGRLRVAFHCGFRSLADYGWRHDAWRGLAQLFTTGEREVPELVTQLVAERRALERRVRDLEIELARERAPALIARAETVGGVRVLTLVADGELDAARALAAALVAHPQVVTVVGCMSGGRPRLVAAAAADVGIDVGPVVRDAARLIGGRGGGRPRWAEAGGEEAARLPDALAAAEAQMRALLAAGSKQA